jgi:hypothetical protein
MAVGAPAQRAPTTIASYIFVVLLLCRRDGDIVKDSRVEIIRSVLRHFGDETTYAATPR